MNHTTPKQPRRGFSLMEVLIAMGIAGVGMCGILTALPMIAFQVQKVRSQVSGKQLANLAEETIRLQKWADPKTNGGGSGNTDLAWKTGVTGSEKVPVDKPIAIDPWSEVTSFTLASPPFSSVNFWKPFPAPHWVAAAGVTAARDAAKWTFLDPTAIKMSAHPASERPELTYVSLNNSIAPDRSDDYSWFYTVLPRVKQNNSAGAIASIPVAEIDAYHVSVVVSRKRAFDDDATHRVYTINALTPGAKADKVTLAGQASLGKYVAVMIPMNPSAATPVVWTDVNGDWYGCCFRWYKVITSRENTATGETSVLLHRLEGDNDLPSMPSGNLTGTGSFLLTIDSVINVKSFEVQ